MIYLQNGLVETRDPESCSDWLSFMSGFNYANFARDVHQEVTQVAARALLSLNQGLQDEPSILRGVVEEISVRLPEYHRTSCLINKVDEIVNESFEWEWSELAGLHFYLYGLAHMVYSVAFYLWNCLGVRQKLTEIQAGFQAIASNVTSRHHQYNIERLVGQCVLQSSKRVEVSVSLKREFNGASKVLPVMQIELKCGSKSYQLRANRVVSFASRYQLERDFEGSTEPFSLSSVLVVEFDLSNKGESDIHIQLDLAKQLARLEGVEDLQVILPDIYDRTVSIDGFNQSPNNRKAWDSRVDASWSPADKANSFFSLVPQGKTFFPKGDLLFPQEPEATEERGWLESLKGQEGVSVGDCDWNRRNLQAFISCKGPIMEVRIKEGGGAAREIPLTVVRLFDKKEGTEPCPEQWLAGPMQKSTLKTMEASLGDLYFKGLSIRLDPRNCAEEMQMQLAVAFQLMTLEGAESLVIAAPFSKDLSAFGFTEHTNSWLGNHRWGDVRFWIAGSDQIGGDFTNFPTFFSQLPEGQTFFPKGGLLLPEESETV